MGPSVEAVKMSEFESAKDFIVDRRLRVVFKELKIRTITGGQPCILP